MVETIIVCTTILIIVAAMLWFADKHVRTTKQYRQELVSYIDGRVNADLAAFQKNVQSIVETLQDKDAKEMLSIKTQMVSLNSNQVTLMDEFRTLKNAKGISSGPLSRLQRGPATND